MSQCAGRGLFANRAEPDEKDNIFEKKRLGYLVNYVVFLIFVENITTGVHRGWSAVCNTYNIIRYRRICYGSNNEFMERGGGPTLA